MNKNKEKINEKIYVEKIKQTYLINKRKNEKYIFVNTSS